MPEPASCRPGSLSMTVIGPELGLADAYATAAFAMGRAGLGGWMRYPGYSGCAITTRCAAGLDARLRPLAGVVRL